VLDTLEYARAGTRRLGLVSSGKMSIAGGRKLVPAGVAAAVDLDAVPVACSRLLARAPGPPMRIMSGEIGGIRLTEPLVLPNEDGCEALAAHRELTEMPALPKFVPAPKTARGPSWATPSMCCCSYSRRDRQRVPGGRWLPTQKRSFFTVTREVTAAIASRPAMTAP